MAAAVSDWRAAKPAVSKIKRDGAKVSIEFVENPDILKELGAHKNYVLTGFALETGDLEKNAFGKLKSKNLDIIVANKLDKNRKLFGDNKISIVLMDRLGGRKAYSGCSKRRLAKIILDKAFTFNIK